MPNTVLCTENNMRNKMDMVIATIELLTYNYIMLTKLRVS